MPKIPLPISNGFYVSDALPISNQRCVNFRPNIPQSDTVTADNLFNTEGLTEILDLSNLNNNCRGAHVMDGIPYFVIGQNLYQIRRTFSFSNPVYESVDRGVIEGVGRVYMADNGEQLCICVPPDEGFTDGKSYIFDAPATLTEINDADFDGPASYVVFSDGFFIFAKADGKKFFNSQLNDGLSYDALDFSQAESDPDNIRAIGVLKSQLYVIGSETTQLFRNIGRSPAPFQGIPGATIDLGIFSPQTLIKYAGGLAFVGGAVNESPSVWLVSDGTKRKLSTTAIDNELSKLSDTELDGLFSWVYGESGSFFLGISTPGTTYVYDLAVSRWHERQSINGAALSQFRASHLITTYGQLWAGDVQGGKVGALKEDIYTEYGNLIYRYVTSKPFDNLGEPIFLNSIEAVTENGVGLTSNITVNTGVVDNVPQTATGGADPKITLSWSDDGGRIFKGLLSRSMGKIGEFAKRQIWRRLGRFPRSRVIRLEISSPTKATIIKIEADVRG